MKMIYYLRFALFFVIFVGYGQQRTQIPKEYFNYEYFKKKINGASESSFATTLAAYDSLIVLYPNNIDLRIEKCRVIEWAFYNEYDDYNPKQKEHDACLDSLYLNYANVPEVILYKIECTYGDALKDVLIDAESEVIINNDSWKDNQVAEVYYNFAEYYFYYEDDNPQKAWEYIEKAMDSDVEKDMSLLYAEIAILNEREDEAKKALLKFMNNKTDIDPWTMKEKARVMVALEMADEALKMYTMVEETDSTYIENKVYAETFEKLGNLDLAREYLIKDTINNWDTNLAARNLFLFDLRNSDKNRALESYRAYTKLSYFGDFWGFYRWRLFFEHPQLWWNFKEISHVIVFLLSVFLIFIIPYLWILPLHYSGRFFKKRIENRSKTVFDWNLKHFWIVSFYILAVSILLEALFNYEVFLYDYFELSYDYDAPNDTNTIMHIWYFIISFIAISFFFNKNRINYLINSKFGISKSVVLGVLFVIFNVIFTKVLDTNGSELTIEVLNIREVILSISTEYGFLLTFFLVAIIVPIYEEVIFRGIILSSVDKKLGFWMANTIQALLFALIHDNLPLFPFYFVFGMIVGYTARKSSGLLTGIIFHSMNNAVAVISLKIAMSLSS